MSGLESERRPVFEIAKDEVDANASVAAMPFNLRKQAVDEFNRRTRFEMMSTPIEESNVKIVEDYLQLPEYLANAIALQRGGELDLAESLFRNVLKVDPTNELALRGVAQSESAKGQHENAFSTLKGLIVTNPTAKNYKLLADELYILEFYQDAIENYLYSLKDASMVEPEELFSIYKNLGNSLLKLGDHDGAEENYNKAFTICPESDVLLVNFASLAIYRGDLEAALHRFREAIKVNDQNDQAWVGLAMVHREYGDAELSWANLEKCLDLNPANASAVRLVCEWAMKDNEVEKAGFRIEMYLRVRPKDAQMHMWLAKFQFFLGLLPQAMRSIEQALRLDPELDGGAEVLKVVHEELNLREARSK